MTALEEVRAYVEAQGGTVDIFQFDCGEILTLNIPGLRQRRFRAECGDDQSAPELALTVVRQTVAEAARLAAAIEVDAAPNDSTP